MLTGPPPKFHGTRDILPSWIAAQLRSSGSNFGANRYNDLHLTEVCRRKAFDLL